MSEAIVQSSQSTWEKHLLYHKYNAYIESTILTNKHNSSMEHRYSKYFINTTNLNVGESIDISANMLNNKEDGVESGNNALDNPLRTIHIYSNDELFTLRDRRNN